MQNHTPVPLTFGELFSWCAARGGEFLEIGANTFRFLVADSTYLWVDGAAYRL